jgi:hypothetical protein
MNRILIAAALAATTLLAACGEEADPCLGATDVKQCEATRAATGGGSNNGLLYGLGGYALGRMSGGGGGSTSTHTRTVERHYYTAPARSQMRSPSYTYRSTPSYSSYRSTPSYSYRSSSISFGRRK